MARKKKDPQTPEGMIQGELKLPPQAQPPTQPPAQPTAPPVVAAQNTEAGKPGLVSFRLSEKLPNAFGEYSSLDMEIGLVIPGDPNQFEAMIDKFLPRVVLKIQGTMNQITTGSGFKALWVGANPSGK